MEHASNTWNKCFNHVVILQDFVYTILLLHSDKKTDEPKAEDWDITEISLKVLLYCEDVYLTLYTSQT